MPPFRPRSSRARNARRSFSPRRNRRPKSAGDILKHHGNLGSLSTSSGDLPSTSRSVRETMSRIQSAREAKSIATPRMPMCSHSARELLSRRISAAEMLSRSKTRVPVSSLTIREKIVKVRDSIERDHSPERGSSRNTSPTFGSPRAKKKLPPVMACLKPENVIIADAAERIRRQLIAKDVLSQTEAAHRSSIDDRILLREKKNTLALHRQQDKAQKVFLMKTVKCLVFMSLLATHLRMSRRMSRPALFYSRSLAHCSRVSDDMDDDDSVKLELISSYRLFVQSICKHKWRITLAFSILRKRASARILRQSLQAVQKGPEAKKSISNFLRKIFIVQRAMRSFLAARKARFELLSQEWEKEDFKYCQGVLLERKQQSKKNLENTLGSFKTIPKDVKHNIARQRRRWNTIDKNMKRLLQKIYEDQNIKTSVMFMTVEEESDDDDDGVTFNHVKELMVPDWAKDVAMREIVKEKRREFLAYLELKLKPQKATLPTHSLEEAKLYIGGYKSETADAGLFHSYTFFNLFKMLRENEIRDKIIAVHRHLGTFQNYNV